MAQLSRGRRLMGDINVVPYIDVMLVLLIIFMVTAPLLTQGIKVDLPKAAAQPVDPAKQEPLVISIDARGQLFLNAGVAPGRPIDEEVLGARISAALQKDAERQVLVKADKSISYGRVVEAMVILQKSGAKKVGFLTEPPPTPNRAR